MCDGRRKKEEGIRKKENRRWKKAIFGHRLPLPSSITLHTSHMTPPL
jgi:hypothetical protein